MHCANIISANCCDNFIIAPVNWEIAFARFEHLFQFYGYCNHNQDKQLSDIAKAALSEQVRAIFQVDRSKRMWPNEFNVAETPLQSSSDAEV